MLWRAHAVIDSGLGKESCFNILRLSIRVGNELKQRTVGIAEMLVAEHGMRVLVIYLDPQTNATVSLIDEQAWKDLDENGLTVAQLFIDALSEDPAARRFPLPRIRPARTRAQAGAGDGAPTGD